MSEDNTIPKWIDELFEKVRKDMIREGKLKDHHRGFVVVLIGGSNDWVSRQFKRFKGG